MTPAGRPQPPEGTRTPAWTLSRYLVLLASGTATLALVIVVGLALAWRGPLLEARARAEVRQQASDVAGRSSRVLEALQYRLTQLARLLEATDAAAGAALVRQVLPDDDLIDILALASADGVVQAVGLKSRHLGGRADATGLDLSGVPVFKARHRDSRAGWDGRRLSLFTGEVAVSLSVRLADGRVLVAEIDHEHLMRDIRGLNGMFDPDGTGLGQVWLVDQRGEIFADSRGHRAVGRFNLRNSPLLAPPGPGDSPEGTRSWRHESVNFHVGVVRSEQLGWSTVVMQPAGLDNPMRMTQLHVALLALLLTPMLCLVLTPLLARRMSAALQALVRAASDERQGRPVDQWPQGPIEELNELSGQLGAMSRQIHAQKVDLMTLNADLEQRVEARTQDLASANAALRTSMQDLQNARDDLVRTERLASLGGLVAGVAHELNTPLGNGLLAMSTLQDEMRKFRRSMADGLRKSALDQLIDSVDTASDIASRNIGRAAELVTSFKQVAVDQTSGQRRTFDLADVVAELIRALKPTLSRTPYRLSIDVPEGVQMDSYPGSLGQIIANLVNNAVLHGFDGRDQGEIRIRARLDAGEVLLTVHDDGKGIPLAHQGRVFDPFFTSRMGRGGTGLGLSISHSIATNLLGGSLGFRSADNQGTTFELRMPLSAPRVVNVAGTADADVDPLERLAPVNEPC